MAIENLKILGTSHISSQSLKEVKQAVETFKPEIIALELDRGRFQGLMIPQKKLKWHEQLKILGPSAFLFNLLGAWAENKMGKLTGVSPGSEMKEAARLAIANKIPLAFIDQDVRITLRRLTKKLTLREYVNFFIDIFKAVILRKKEVDFDIKTVPEKKIISYLIENVRKRYPTVHKVLIEERNIFMAKMLKKVLASEKRVLAVVGAGHEDGLLELLK